MSILRILESVLYVEDLDAAESFYRALFGFELVARENGRHLFFRVGESMLLIFDPRATSRAQPSALPVPLHGSRGEGHLAFAVREEDLSSWKARLLQLGIEVEREIEWPRGGRSIYFRDPGRNSVELATPGVWGFRS